MIETREDLIKELQSCECECEEMECDDCPHRYNHKIACFLELIADRLVSHGYVSETKQRSWVQYALAACYVALAVLSALSAGTAPNLFGQVVNTLMAVAYILVAVFTAMEG